MKIKSFESINSDTRISSIDVFRGFAILAVVVFHFNTFLPYGFLGVDLFFVISGYLVGSILIEKFKKNERINFFKFFIQRGFKIWPSYYFFLGIGTVLAIIFYSNSRPEYIIGGGKDVLRYLLFYQNYTGMPFHLPFDHVWSLCVEEHFYIILPIMIIIIKSIFGNNGSILLLSIVFFIIVGIFFKYLSINFTNSKDTYAGTHNRIDALGWGVLLAVIIIYSGAKVKAWKWRKFCFPVGLLLLCANIFILEYTENFLYRGIVFHSLTPFCFFMMIFGVFYFDFRRLKVIKFIAYYSYNWYLWHPLYVATISDNFGISIFGLLVYITSSFLTAFIFTVLVEENFLRL